MAQKVYEMALALAGKLDPSLNSTFATAARNVNKLDSQLKELNAAQKKIGQYKTLSARIGQTSGQFDAAREKTKLLAAELLRTEEPTQRLINQFEKARAKTDKLKMKLSEQRSQLKNLDRELSGAGISTRKLIDENSRLAREADKVTAAKKRQVLISNTLNQVQTKTSALATSTYSKIQSAATGLGVAAVGGIGIVSAGVGYSLKLAGEMEQANIAFETMLGSADKAKQFMNDLTDFAVKTPFEMPQLRDASRKILAFGFDSQKVIPMLTAVGDAASGLGLGGEGMERIVIALGQMKAKAKVSGDEMLQLTEAGVPAWEILADAMGKTTPEVMKLSEKGLLPANEAIDMLVAGMEKKFPKMMDKQSRSLFGLLSTLKDFANLKFFYAFGEGLRKSAVPALEKFVDMLDKNKDGTKTIQDRLESLGQTVGTSVVSKFEKLYNWILLLENDEKFKNMNWGDKFITVLDQGLTALDDWITKGEGKGKLDGVISKIAEISAKAWFNAETNLITNSLKNLGTGETAAGAGEMVLANKLSGGLLALLGIGTAKGAWSLGGKLITLLRSGGAAAGTTDAVALLASLQGGGGAAAGTAGAAGILAPIVGTASSVLWGGYNMHRASEAKAKGDNAGYWLDLYAGINPFAYLASSARDNWIDWQHPASQSVTGTTTDTNLALDAISRGGQEQDKLTGQVEAGTQAMEFYAKVTGQGADSQTVAKLSLINLTTASNMATMALLNLRWNAINAGTIPGHATGTRNWGGGLTWINERGGEIIDLPRGSRIYPADKSEKMMGGEGGIVYAPQVTIQGNASKADMNAVMNANFHQFTRWFEEYQDDKRRREY